MEQGNAGYEMAPMNNNSNQSNSNNPGPVFQEIEAIKFAMREVQEQVNNVQQLHSRTINGTGSERATDGSSATLIQQVDAKNGETTTMYKALGDRVRRLEVKPEARTHTTYKPVQALKRSLREAVNDFSRIEAGQRERVKEQMQRQYRIVNPAASEAEAREAVQDTSSSNQMFSQAVCSPFIYII